MTFILLDHFSRLKREINTSEAENDTSDTDDINAQGRNVSKENDHLFSPRARDHQARMINCFEGSCRQADDLLFQPTSSNYKYDVTCETLFMEGGKLQFKTFRNPNMRTRDAPSTRNIITYADYNELD